MHNNYVTLYNGVKMPQIIFGTDNLRDENDAENIIYQAILNGYRHIDSAEIYHNEVALGKAVKRAIKDGICARKDLFITTKAPFSSPGYENILKGYNDSLNRLDMEYIDLYLLHHNYRQFHDPRIMAVNSWRGMEKIYQENKVRAIGVSNFDDGQFGYSIYQIVWESFVKPMVNQIQCHPQYQQNNIIEYCKKEKIAISCWGALNQGRIFSEDIFKNLAMKYNKTIPQITLRWSIQRGLSPIAKTVNNDRMIENLDIMNFAISDEDMEILNSLDGGEHSDMHTLNDCLISNMNIPSFKNFLASINIKNKTTYKVLGIPVINSKSSGNPLKTIKTTYSFLGIPLLDIVKKGEIK